MDEQLDMGAWADTLGYQHRREGQLPPPLCSLVHTTITTTINTISVHCQ